MSNNFKKERTNYAFWKKAFNKKSAVHFPQAIVQGKPVETETIAGDLAKISTVSNSDVQAVRVQFTPDTKDEAPEDPDSGDIVDPGA